jgi:putative tricarboxylic transport membrane protein
LGVLLSCVGVAPVDGSLRFTFGFHSLDAGFNILPLLIGLFAVSEILVLAEEVLTSRQKDFIVREVKREKGFGVSLEEVKSQLGNLFRSSVIGTGIGILPGIGSGTSSMLSYLAAKNSDKRHSERYGTGYIGGIVASETANNATTGGALIPLLTLGIPGDSVTAMILAGFTIHGITPGPLLFTSHTNLVYGIFIAFFLANLIMVVMELFGINLFIKLIKIPRYILMPITMVFCFVGTYGLNNRVFDVWTVLAFGIMGYVLNKLNIPLIPIMLGFILGPLMEKNLRRGLMQAGSFGAFFQSPITTFFLACTVLSVLWSLYNNIKTFKQKITAQEAKK